MYYFIALLSVSHAHFLTNDGHWLILWAVLPQLPSVVLGYLCSISPFFSLYICFVYTFACAWAHMYEWKCTYVRSYGDPRLWSGNIIHCSSIFPTEAGPLSQAQIWLRLFLPAALSWPFLILSFWGSDYRWTTPLQSLRTCWASVLWSSCLAHTLTNYFPASVSNILDELAFVPVGNYSHHHMEPASSINIHILSTIFSKLSWISLFPLFFIFFSAVSWLKCF